MSKKLLKSTSTVAGMTMISRVMGFVRDMVIAQFFGVGPGVDAFIVANKIPNFMRRLFAEGAFSQAFVPVLSEYRQQGDHARVKQLVNRVAGNLAIILLLFTLLAELFAPYLILVFAPGFDHSGPRYIQAAHMLRITFPYLMLVSLTAFSGAILNSYDRFAIPAFTPVILNLAMIAAAIVLSPHMVNPVESLAWGVFLGGVVQLLFQVPFLYRQNLLPIPKIDFKDPGVRKILRLMAPAILGVSVAQVNLFVDTIFASLLPVGSVSWLYYSDRLMNLPLGVFGVAVATVVLPHLSRQHAAQSAEQYSRSLDWGLRTVLLVGLPAAVGLFVIAGPLLATLFMHGKFNAFDVEMARKSLMGFAAGVWAFMLVKVLAAGFYAKQNIKTPVKIAIVAMFANIGFILLLIGPLKHAGLALATSVSGFVNAGLLLILLLRKGYFKPLKGWGVFLVRLVLANALMVLWVRFQEGSLQRWFDMSSVDRCLNLLLLMGVAMIIYVGVLFVTGMRVEHLKLKEN